MSPRASVIVLTCNGRDVLADCLESIFDQELDGGLETIVVDNASSDGTEELLSRLANRIRLIRNEHNAGFSTGNNQAAAVAEGRTLVFLNDDTKLCAPDTLERLVAAAEAPGVGVAGPRLLNEDGSLQPSCASDPTFANSLLLGSGAWRLLPTALRGRVLAQHWSHDRPIDVDWVKGAAFAVRADAFREAGGFWPRLYGEEQDLAYRVRRLGLRVRFESSARIVHRGNHTLAKLQSDADRARRVASAELAFLQAHYPRTRATAIRAVAGMGHALRALTHTLLARPDKARVSRSLARTYATGPRD